MDNRILEIHGLRDNGFDDYALNDPVQKTALFAHYKRQAGV